MNQELLDGVSSFYLKELAVGFVYTIESNIKSYGGLPRGRSNFVFYASFRC